MALRPISDIRRQELRAAALRVLQREGLSGTTLEKVAAEAGASKGIVLHYFRSKDDLFEQVMREANLVLRDRVIARLRQAEGPLARLHAIIDGNFEPDLYTVALARAWLSLCEAVPRNPALARIQTVIHARMHANLMSALAVLTGRDEAAPLALRLSALIDGLWLRRALGTRPITAQEAGALVRAELAAAVS